MILFLSQGIVTKKPPVIGKVKKVLKKLDNPLWFLLETLCKIVDTSFTLTCFFSSVCKPKEKVFIRLRRVLIKSLSNTLSLKKSTQSFYKRFTKKFKFTIKTMKAKETIVKNTL